MALAFYIVPKKFTENKSHHIFQNLVVLELTKTCLSQSQGLRPKSPNQRAERKGKKGALCLCWSSFTIAGLN
ncbi:hypothetical protein CFP56_020450 [Quercus suber]|uniref:Uncharacterized protein n=1 Tax=Quercus suber TaxID=58331 RepID=A0AAW0M091_QUESU